MTQSATPDRRIWFSDAGLRDVARVSTKLTHETDNAFWYRVRLADGRTVTMAIPKH